jgi:hypothetical protein
MPKKPTTYEEDYNELLNDPADKKCSILRIGLSILLLFVVLGAAGFLLRESKTLVLVAILINTLICYIIAIVSGIKNNLSIMDIILGSLANLWLIAIAIGGPIICVISLAETNPLFLSIFTILFFIFCRWLKILENPKSIFEIVIFLSLSSGFIAITAVVISTVVLSFGKFILRI